MGKEEASSEITEGEFFKLLLTNLLKDIDRGELPMEDAYKMLSGMRIKMTEEMMDDLALFYMKLDERQINLGAEVR